MRLAEKLDWKGLRNVLCGQLYEGGEGEVEKKGTHLFRERGD
jgi:hypothetical protein